ncbi:MAG: HIRAN domain-containing protein [Anaerovoracaceae bacterium]|jgi:hypothetical protein
MKAKKNRKEKKAKIYFTIAGTKYFHGREFFEAGQTVRLVKEPDNEADHEAIKVEMKGLGQVGYVANSPYTVIGESWSAGRIYDRIGETAVGKVLFVTGHGILCRLRREDADTKNVVGTSEDLQEREPAAAAEQ